MMSLRHQVLLDRFPRTHLPQIAALADNHFAIEKKTTGNRVLSSLKKLSHDEKVTEVAKLLSGEDVTSASLSSARELMNYQN